MGRQRSRNAKWYLSPTFGVGALVRTNRGETWEVIDDEITESGKTARIYVAPNLGMTFGRHYEIASAKFDIYGRGNAVIPIGFNNTVVPLLSLEIGVRFIPHFSFQKTAHPLNRI